MPVTPTLTAAVVVDKVDGVKVCPQRLFRGEVRINHDDGRDGRHAWHCFVDGLSCQNPAETRRWIRKVINITLFG